MHTFKEITACKKCGDTECVLSPLYELEDGSILCLFCLEEQENRVEAKKRADKFLEAYRVR